MFILPHLILICLSEYTHFTEPIIKGFFKYLVIWGFCCLLFFFCFSVVICNITNECLGLTDSGIAAFL